MDNHPGQHVRRHEGKTVIFHWLINWPPLKCFFSLPVWAPPPDFHLVLTELVARRTVIWRSPSVPFECWSHFVYSPSCISVNFSGSGRRWVHCRTISVANSSIRNWLPHSMDNHSSPIWHNNFHLHGLLLSHPEPWLLLLLFPLSFNSSMFIDTHSNCTLHRNSELSS